MTGDVRRATARLPEYRYYRCSGKAPGRAITGSGPD